MEAQVKFYQEANKTYMEIDKKDLELKEVRDELNLVYRGDNSNHKNYNHNWNYDNTSEGYNYNYNKRYKKYRR